LLPTEELLLATRLIGCLSGPPLLCSSPAAALFVFGFSAACAVGCRRQDPMTPGGREIRDEVRRGSQGRGGGEPMGGELGARNLVPADALRSAPPPLVARSTDGGQQGRGAGEEEKKKESADGAGASLYCAVFSTAATWPALHAAGGVTQQKQDRQGKGWPSPGAVLCGSNCSHMRAWLVCGDLSQLIITPGVQ